MSLQSTGSFSTPLARTVKATVYRYENDPSTLVMSRFKGLLWLVSLEWTADPTSSQRAIGVAHNLRLGGSLGCNNSGSVSFVLTLVCPIW